MQRLKKLIQDNRVFFIGYIIILCFGSILLFSLGKVATFYFLNPIHGPILNNIFFFFTILGDGFFVVPLAFSLLLIKQKKLFWLILSGYIVSGLVILLLKDVVNEARPSVYEGLKNYPYFIDKITLHNYHGFPSGHTASAFATSSVLAFYSRSKKLAAIILLIVAMVIGYSRIYLGEHFISDVMVGSMIGVISGIICWNFIEKKNYFKNSSLPAK